MTKPLTENERMLLDAIERHTMESNGQLFIDIDKLAAELGLDQTDVPRLLDVIAKLCRERGLGYSVMEGGGLKPS